MRSDNLSHPLADAQNEAKERAQAAVLHGKATMNSDGVVRVAHGQFVELARQGEDRIWTTLGEFTDLAHNNIPEPDRTVDNSTYWVGDFSRAHYEDMLFDDSPGANSMRNFYIEQSSNRYTVDGIVEDWVEVDGPQAAYSDALGSNATWPFIEQSVDNWYAGQIADGMTPSDINDYLSQFDVWDRYDHDGDGNFDEPDGYIDHYQAIHSGGGAEAGVADAIWSHRWYVQLTPIGSGGPTLADGTVVPYGGTQVGDSNYWIGDYTTEPENGAVGVFAHEFAHDLGLPDLYDTGGGENTTGFWTLMSSGSWTTQSPDYIGTHPIHMGAWEKFQLGWLNYEVAFAGDKSSHKMGPAETNTKQAQGLFVVLPPKQVDTNIGTAPEGANFFYSGAGNDLDNTMTRTVTVPAGTPMLTAMVNYEIETDWDYAYLMVNGVPIATNRSTATNPNGQNFGHGITGFSGGWVSLTADLSTYAGQTVEIGFRYWTDVAAIETGFMVDDIWIDGTQIGTAEGDEVDWTLDGFRVTSGQETSFHNNYYLAEFRTYMGYDRGLKTGPYNFVGGDWLEHFPYQDGLLISYWDTSQPDNNAASDHPGEGLILPLDAHPDSLYMSNGTPFRNRVQTHDATFSLQRTDAFSLTTFGTSVVYGDLPAVKVFDDMNEYWDEGNPNGFVRHPHTGTKIIIRSVSARGNLMQVQVR
ncbi:MAG: immune inhibitor A [Acidimicrobiia bacterium]